MNVTQDALDNAHKETQDAKNKLSETRDALDNAHKKAQVTQKQLDETQDRLSRVTAELESSQDELVQKKMELESAKNELVQRKTELDATKRELENMTKEREVAGDFFKFLTKIKKIQDDAHNNGWTNDSIMRNITNNSLLTAMLWYCTDIRAVTELHQKAKRSALIIKNPEFQKAVSELLELCANICAGKGCHMMGVNVRDTYNPLKHEYANEIRTNQETKVKKVLLDGLSSGNAVLCKAFVELTNDE